MKFFKELQKRIFPTLIALSALSVSASAAFYSISGLSKLFAGASFEVIIMATSLEVAKLVIASLLYQYWGRLNKLLRTYLSLAAIVLVLITSAGIYGFLSAAYQETATKSEIVESEVQVLEMRKTRFEENRTFYVTEKEQLDEGIAELRKGLSNNVIQYRDQETGEIITTTSSSTRRALQSQLDEAIVRRDQVSEKLENVTDSISSLDIKILDVNSNAEIASELGPLKYLSNLTNTPMNKIINVLLLVIIFVFDPLAISLVIAANFAFDQLRKKNKVEEDEESEEESLKEEYIEKEWDNTLQDGLEDELWDEEYLNELQPVGPYLKEEDVEVEEDIEELSKKAGQIEKEMVKEEVKPLNPSEELIKRLEKELEKLTAQKEEDEKTSMLTTDFIEKVNKLSEVIDLGDKEVEDEPKGEETPEIKEEPKEDENPEVIPTPNKRRITYRRRDGGRNIRTQRI